VAGSLDLPSLNAILPNAGDYPVTSQTMAARARSWHAPISVVNFFESIPAGVEFKNKADVIRRSQETEILMEEESGEPDEELRSYD
jgi:hypothetical protein